MFGVNGTAAFDMLFAPFRMLIGVQMASAMDEMNACGTWFLDLWDMLQKGSDTMSFL